MRQAKFSITREHLEFLNRHRELGYRDRSELVRDALERLRSETERRRLEESAVLYAEVYADEPALTALTEAAMADWPR